MKDESPEEGEHDSDFLEKEVREAIAVLSSFLRGSNEDEKKIKKITQTFSCHQLTAESIVEQQISRVILMVLESILQILSSDSELLSIDQDYSSFKWPVSYLVSLGHLMLSNLDSLLRDANGVQLLVTTVEVLGGVRVGRQWSRKTMGFAMRSSITKELEKDNVFERLPHIFESILKKFAKKLIINRSNRYLKETILGKGTSLIQNLLFILKVRLPDTCQTAVNRLVDVIFLTADNRVAITTNSVSAYLVEAIMLVTSHSRLNHIWERHLKGNLSEMWKHDIANFVVQRLIDAVQDINLLTAICDEMLPKLATVFAYNRPGIGVCLAKAAERFPGMQPVFIEALMKAFNCHEPRDRQVYLVRLMLFEDSVTFQTKKRRNLQTIWLHGSLMLQYMFRYSEPYKLSKSLLALEARKLVAICNDKSGSHVIDCFLLSPSVMERHKSTFKEKLRGHYAYIASDRFGSRVIDSLLANSDLKTRNNILDELTNHDFLNDCDSRRSVSKQSRISPSPSPPRSPKPRSHVCQLRGRCARAVRTIEWSCSNGKRILADDCHHVNDFSVAKKSRRC